MNNNRFGGLVLACAAFAATLFGTPVLAASAPVLTPEVQKILDSLQVQAKNQDSFAFDYGIPTSPTLTLIGTSTAISSPSADMKPYVFSLPASFGGSKDAQAFSFDISTMWGLRQLGSAPARETYEDFLGLDYWGQLAYRTRLGGALYLGDDGNGDATKAKASRIAFGLSTSLLGSSDPVTVKDDKGRPAWSGCVDDVFDSPQNKQLWLAFDASSEFDVSSKIQSVEGKVRQALTFPNAGNLQIALAGMEDCLGPNGVCKKYDADSNLQSAHDALVNVQANAALSTADKDSQTTAVLQKAQKQLAAMDSKANLDVTKSSAVYAKQFGIDKALGGCIEKTNALARNSADLDVGAGVVWSGTPGKVERFTDASGSIWVAGRFPIGVFDPDVTAAANYGSDTTSLMLGGALRATFGQPIATGVAATPFFKANVFDGWVGLERYAASSRFAAQIGYMDTEATNAAFKTFSKSGVRWLVSASFRADKFFNGLLTGYLVNEDPNAPPENGIWLNATYGSSGGTVTTLDDKTVMISLSFSPSEDYAVFSDKPPQ